ncbi:MAG: zf-HC2 domain-containing protein [Planctomycetota bacterium]
MTEQRPNTVPTACTQVLNLVARDLERELSPAEAEIVATHLAGCGRCATELTRGAELDPWLRVTDAELPNAFEWRRVDRGVFQAVGRATQFQETRAPAVQRQWSRLSVFGAGALAALFVLAVSIFVAMQNTGDPSRGNGQDLGSFSLMSAEDNATQVIVLPDTDEEAIVVYLASNE